jgi:hypothetical protein
MVFPTPTSSARIAPLLNEQRVRVRDGPNVGYKEIDSLGVAILATLSGLCTETPTVAGSSPVRPPRRKFEAKLSVLTVLTIGMKGGR